MKLTLRQIFYRMLEYGLDNNQNQYKGLSRHLVKARKRGDIPADCMVDETRREIGGDFYSDCTPDEYIEWKIQELSGISDNYGLSRWEDQDYYLELWTEKDTLLSVISDVVNSYGVKTISIKGYNSFSKMNESADRFRDHSDKKCIILHQGDLDPTGWNCTKSLQDRINDFEGVDVKVERICLNIDQVKKYNLPPNNVKMSDTRSPPYIKLFGSECWEADALKPNIMLEIIRESIEKYIDFDIIMKVLNAEKKDREYIDSKIDEYLSGKE